MEGWKFFIRVYCFGIVSNFVKELHWVLRITSREVGFNMPDTTAPVCITFRPSTSIYLSVCVCVAWSQEMLDGDDFLHWRLTPEDSLPQIAAHVTWTHETLALCSYTTTCIWPTPERSIERPSLIAYLRQRPLKTHELGLKAIINYWETQPMTELLGVGTLPMGSHNVTLPANTSERASP